MPITGASEGHIANKNGLFIFNSSVKPLLHSNACKFDVEIYNRVGWQVQSILR